MLQVFIGCLQLLFNFHWLSQITLRLPLKWHPWSTKCFKFPLVASNYSSTPIVCLELLFDLPLVASNYSSTPIDCIKLLFHSHWLSWIILQIPLVASNYSSTLTSCLKLLFDSHWLLVITLRLSLVALNYSSTPVGYFWKLVMVLNDSKRPFWRPYVTGAKWKDTIIGALTFFSHLFLYIFMEITLVHHLARFRKKIILI